VHEQEEGHSDGDGEEVFFSALLPMGDAAGLGRLTERLWQAERARTFRLFTLLTTQPDALSGLDALLGWLDDVEQWADGRWSGALQILVQRVRGDVETYVEAMLSGSDAVCSDAARDLMETEFLIRDFVADPGRAEAWMAADRRGLVRDFGPGPVRAREAERRHPGACNALPDEAEYQVHSQVTHPTPGGGRARDLAPDDEAFPLPYAVFELLEHVLRCADALAPVFDASAPTPEAAAPFAEAYWSARVQMEAVVPDGLLPDRVPRRKGDRSFLPGL
jgi:hypothetical protein